MDRSVNDPLARHDSDSQAATLADLAHELRTPLGGIDSIADLLGLTVSSPEQRRLIAGLKAASAHLRAVASHVIDGDGDLASFHRLLPMPISMSAFLEPIAVAAAARAEVRGGAFHVDCRLPRATMLEIDPVRTRQMIENLIDNAGKIAPDGEITLVLERQVNELVIRVLDRGPGFTKADLEQLFQRRMQVDGGPRGSGIGLSLVRRYAQEAGGSCGAANREGGGAEIWFSLPGAFAQPDAGRAIHRALVIEDSYAGRLLLRTMLEHFGFSVELAASASAAFDAVSRESFDLITVDKILGEADGIEVTRLLRQKLSHDPALRIIAVTGRVDDADRTAFSQAGASAFLPKPVSPRSLAEALSRLGLTQRAESRAA